MAPGLRRRRWCDSVLEAPAGYRQLLTALQAGAVSSQQHGSPEALKLLSQLAAFSSSPYHHGDPDPIKAITAAADQLAAVCPADSPGWQHCMQALLELLFMHSSRPIHKQLLSFVRKLGPAHQDVVGQVLVGSVTREAAAVLLAGSYSQQQPEWVPLQQAGVSPAVAVAVLAAPPRLPAAAVNRGFDLAQAAISLLQMPAARAWLQPAGPLLLLAIARSIQTTLDPQQHPTATAAGKQQVQPPPQQHLTAKTIELVQDAINVMYMVLQYHGQHTAAAAAAAAGPTAGSRTTSAADAAAAAAGEQGADAAAAGEQGALALASIFEAAQSMLCALQGSLVVREALASAAVVVWSVAILPAVPPTAAALAVAAGLTPGQLPPELAAAAAAVAGAHGVCAGSGSISARAHQLLQAWRGSSLLEQQLALQGRSLVAELQAAPHVARVCALRGLLAAMPSAALAGDLGVSPRPATDSSDEQAAARSGSDIGGCSFIMQCGLPFALEAARDAPDAHVKFFAMSLLASVLEGAAAQLWGSLEEQQLQLASTAAPLAHDAATGAVGPDAAAAADGQGGEGSGEGRADGLIVPWLSSTDAQAVMALLSSHMDEPVAQVLAKVQESFEALLNLIKVQHDVAEKLRLQPPRSGGNTAAAAAAAPAASDATRSSTGAAGGTAELGAPMLDADIFLHDTAQSVLALGATRKGRYQPLTALLPHMGALALLQLQPGLVAETIDAMQTNTCASAAAGFFKALLLQLRTELPAGSDTGSSTPTPAGVDPLLQHVPAPMQAWCSCWLPEVLSALWEQGERARSYVANYALPMVLQAEPLLLQPMVDTILAAHAADAGAAGARAAAAGGVDRVSRVQQGTGGARDAAATLAVVLRAARRLQLVGDLDILLPHPQQPEEDRTGADDSSSIAVSPAALLLSAVSSATASLRIEALELVCVSARTTAPPGVLELLVAQRWLTLCLRCTGADSRHKSLAQWEKLLARQAAAVRCIRHRAAVANTPGATGGAHPKGLPRAPRSLLSAPPGTAPAAAESDAEAEERQLVFLSWLSRTLLDSLYPGAAYERKYFALELMAVLLQQWLHADPSSGTAGMPSRKGQHKPAALATAAAGGGGGVHEPFLAGLLSPGCVQTLLGCVVDSWDKMRIAAAGVLQLMPAPLPGCTPPQQLLPLLSWAVQLLHSPRVRESDAGARTLQLLASKYLLGLGWTLKVTPEPSVAAAETAGGAGADVGTAATAAQCCKQQGSSGSSRSSTAGGLVEDQVVQAAATFLSSLTAQLRAQLAAAQADVAAASRHGLVHGTLLCLKYTVEALPWTTLASSSSASISMPASAAAAAACGLSGRVYVSSDGQQGEVVVVCGPVPCVLHCWVTDLAALLTAVADLVKPWLSAQDVNVAANEVEEADDDFSDTELDGEPSVGAAATGAVGAAAPCDAAAGATGGGLSGPAVQLLISACWTSYKEASLLIGTLAARLPLPKSTAVGSSTPGAQDSSSLQAGSAANGVPGSQQPRPQQQQLIECQQLEQLGSLQLSMLLSMKHNGAVEKSQDGFIALLERLLESPEACLNQLPRRWLGQCLDRVQQQGQSRDDIVRRSAGLPFAICSIFLAEPVGVPRQLLPYGLKQLLDIASNEGLQEPWPRVHAFNTLRVVFNDSNMAMDSSGFHAAGVVAAINGMTAPAWEVRNAAALTFAALMLRVVGARNIDARQQKLLKPLNQLAATPAGLHTISGSGSSSSGSGSGSGSTPVVPQQQQGPTAADFFSRYPQLHAFLLQQLQAAVNQQQQQQQQQAGAACSSSGSGVDTVPPTLFPSLILLSRLRPQLLTSASQAAGTSTLAGAGAEVESGGVSQGSTASPAAAAAGPAPPAVGLDPAVFVPALLAVARSPVMGVRSIAAAALTPLVPAEQLHAVCLHLADALPAAAEGDSTQQAGAPVSSQNALHGSLLQLTALLAETSNGSSESHSNAGSCAALVQQLLPAFVQGSKLLASTSSRSCCAVRQAFVAAAGQLLVLAYKQWPLLLQHQHQQQLQPPVNAAASAVLADSSCVGLLQQLVATLQASCLSAIQGTVPAAAGAEGASSSADSQDPLYSCWLRDCAALLLGPLLQLQLVLHKHAHSSTDAVVVAYQLQLLADVLPLALTSSLYEVRAAALKAAAVQLERVLALCCQAHLPLTGNSSSVAAAVRTLAACVWHSLRQQQVVKVTKRLLGVWGHIQCLQQLLLPGGMLPDKQCGVEQQQQHGGDAGSAGLEQLRVLLDMTDASREPEARAHALLCAARVTRELTAYEQQQPAQDSAIHSSRGSAEQGSGVGSNVPLAAFTRLLGSFSAAHQPEQLRAAAAEALSLSGLLLPLARRAGQQTSGHGPATSHMHTGGDTAAAGPAAAVGAPAQGSELPGACLEAWLLALRLMEDEDEDVRQAAAAAAQQALQLVPPALLQPLPGKPVVQQQQQQQQQHLVGEAGGGGRSQAAASALAGAGAVATSGLQYVAAVQCSCCALLARCAAWCPEVQSCLVEHLQQLVFPADTAVPLVLQKHTHLHQHGGSGSPSSAAAAEPATASGGAAQEACMQHIQLPGVALRRLFEREADNHHEEQLLLAQHAAAALRHTLAHTAPNPRAPCQAQLEALLSSWCAGVVSGFLQGVAGGLTAQGCVGDVHHPEVFVPLYRCCLGLWAVGPSLLQQAATWSNSSTTAAAAGQQGPSSWPEALVLLGQLSQLQLPKGLAQAVQAASDGEAHLTAGSASGLLFLLQ